jgi:hypothetical protein
VKSISYGSLTCISPEFAGGVFQGRQKTEDGGHDQVKTKNSKLKTLIVDNASEFGYKRKLQGT